MRRCPAAGAGATAKLAAGAAALAAPGTALAHGTCFTAWKIEQLYLASCVLVGLTLVLGPCLTLLRRAPSFRLLLLRFGIAFGLSLPPILGLLWVNFGLLVGCGNLAVASLVHLGISLAFAALYVRIAQIAPAPQQSRAAGRNR